MADKTAVILDTSAISANPPTLEELCTPNRDYFITSTVLEELETWEKKTAGKVRQELASIESRAREASLEMSSPKYRECADYVEIVKPDRYASRIFYEATKKPVLIDFSKTSRGTKTYFNAFPDVFADVFKALGLGCKLEKNETILISQTLAPTKNAIRIKSENDLNKMFMDYKIVAEMYEQDKKDHEEKNRTFYNAMKVLNHFRLKKDKAVLTGENDPEIERLAAFSAKSIARVVYERDYAETHIKKHDMDDFLESAKLVLQEIKTEETSPILSGITGAIMSRIQRYFNICLDVYQGYVPKNHWHTDANIASIAYRIQEQNPHYGRVIVRTADSDLQTIISLCNSCRKKPGTNVTFELIPA